MKPQPEYLISGGWGGGTERLAILSEWEQRESKSCLILFPEEATGMVRKSLL